MNSDLRVHPNRRDGMADPGDNLCHDLICLTCLASGILDFDFSCTNPLQSLMKALLKLNSDQKYFITGRQGSDGILGESRDTG